MESTLNTCFNCINCLFSRSTLLSFDFLFEFDVFHREISHIWLPTSVHKTCVMENKHILLQLYHCVSVPKIIRIGSRLMKL